MEYAHNKNVKILLWYNSAGDWNSTPQTPRANIWDTPPGRGDFSLWLALGISGLLSLGGLFFGGWAFLRHGREYKAQFPGGYLREDPRPDLSPAVIGALWRFGKVADADIAATLMDLADKGVIGMRPVIEHHDLGAV